MWFPWKRLQPAVVEGSRKSDEDVMVKFTPADQTTHTHLHAHTHLHTHTSSTSGLQSLGGSCRFGPSGSSSSIIRTMRTAPALLLCLLAAGLLSFASCRNEIGPDDCCFRFYPHRVKRTLVRSYYATDQRCSKTAVILVTQRSRHICVDPNLSWVETLLKNLEESSF